MSNNQTVNTTVDLPELLRTVAVADAMAADIKGRAARLRAEATRIIAERYDATREKVAADITLPGVDDTVGSVVTNMHGDETIVTDEDALLAWVQQHAPTEVEYVATIRPSYKAALLKGLEFVDGEATYVDKEAAEAIPVPGVLRKKGSGVKSFTIRGRQDKQLLAYLDSLGFSNMLTAADKVLEAAAATVTGEVVTSEVVREEPAAEDAA